MAYKDAIWIYIVINVIFFTIIGAYCPKNPVSPEDLTMFHQDPAGQQLIGFKNSTMCPDGILTNMDGEPIGVHETNSLNANLIRNKVFVESITHLTRERIPVRVVHAKGAGAFGYFEVTHDITKYCNAKLFERIGKRTRIASRFSLSVVERGGSDLTRNPRGFALKFYTEEGNWDIVGINTPVYFIKDPQYFSSLVRANSNNPVSNVKDWNSALDFFINRPENTLTLFYTFSDLGITDGYRHMPGFSIHAYEILNENGTSHFAKFYFEPDQGVRYINTTEAAIISTTDPDYGTRDLYNAIANGSYPSWTMKMDIMTLEEVKNADFDPFDVTIEWPKGSYLQIPVGRMVLNENPKNNFADVEQLAYDPGNLVPRITGAPDKLFEGRVLAYRDAQNYRLGSNHKQIPVNCPLHFTTYNRDGNPPVLDNGGGDPNYFPNSFNGPLPFVDNTTHKPPYIARHKHSADLSQSSQFYESLSHDEKDRMVANMALMLRNVAPSLRRRAIDFYKTVNRNFVARLIKIL